MVQSPLLVYLSVGITVILMEENNPNRYYSGMLRCPQYDACYRLFLLLSVGPVTAMVCAYCHRIVSSSLQAYIVAKKNYVDTEELISV